MRYAPLGGQHFNTFLRIVATSHPKMNGSKYDFGPPEDPSVQDLLRTAKIGNLYIELDESITEDEARTVADWLNADQNENLANGEHSLLPVVQHTLRLTRARPG